MDEAFIKREKLDDAGKPASRQSPIGWSSLIALTHFLARQVAHEYLEHAGEDVAPRVNTDTTGTPARSPAADHETKD